LFPQKKRNVKGMYTRGKHSNRCHSAQRDPLPRVLVVPSFSVPSALSAIEKSRDKKNTGSKWSQPGPDIAFQHLTCGPESGPKAGQTRASPGPAHLWDHIRPRFLYKGRTNFGLESLVDAGTERRYNFRSLL